MCNFRNNKKESQTAPKVSIIVPVYNTDKYLRNCLDSIISQTYINFEAILVDDGSTDRSGTICDEYASKDNRFIVIHQNNQGVTMARITGFENSHGDYITFIDSDDYVSSDYLGTLVMPIIEDDADIVCCKYNRVSNNIVVFSDNRISGVFQGEDLRSFISNCFLFDYNTKGYGMHPGVAAKMVKRFYVEECIKQGNDLWYGEDLITVLYMLQRCNKLVILPQKIYNYVEHDGEAVRKYNKGLWDNNIELLQRLEFLCNKDNIPKHVLRSRIWKIISMTIYTMQINRINYVLFYEDMAEVRNHPYLKKYFEPWLINNKYGLKGNFGYILLKMKAYRLLWFFENIK